MVPFSKRKVIFLYAEGVFAVSKRVTKNSGHQQYKAACYLPVPITLKPVFQAPSPGVKTAAG